MFNRKADKSLERPYKTTANPSHHQLAFNKALQASPKFIFLDIYQKHSTVTPIFKRSFKSFERENLEVEEEAGSIKSDLSDILRLQVRHFNIYLGKNVQKTLSV